jgi:hypothetical protein
MNLAVATFVRGQSGVALILGTYCASRSSPDWCGLLIGFMAGLLTFIPYVGSMFGLVVATGVALVQFWPELTPIFVVIGIFLFGQFVEGYILSPKLVGESIGLHPVWLMFSLLAFGVLFGFVGLLLAVPLAAAVGVLVRFGLAQYLASRFTPANRAGALHRANAEPCAGMEPASSRSICRTRKASAATIFWKARRTPRRSPSSSAGPIGRIRARRSSDPRDPARVISPRSGPNARVRASLPRAS